MEIQFHTLTLDHELLARAVEFTRQVALLNRNRDRLGDQHVPVSFITDSLNDVYMFRPNITHEPAGYADKFVGTCWQGDRYHGATVIWINPFNAWGTIRPHKHLVETLSHELAHAFTRGKHGFTFRRMYALISPHVYAAFEVEHEWYYIFDIIERYTHKGSSGIDQEYDLHKAASLRMMSRLMRASVIL